MGNNFRIVISAVDRASTVVRTINASMERLTRPITQMQQSVRAFGREMGFDKVGKGIVQVGKSADELAGKLSSVAAPMLAIVGGGTLAGVAALATEWGRLGAEIGRSAAMIGTTSDSLQSLRGAAQAAGLSSEQLSGGLKGLGDTMQDALYGRNQQALVMLKRLGVGIHHTADGSIDAARGFRELSGSIAGIKSAQVQSLVARNLGLEAVLPLLRQGPAAIDAYEQKVAQLGGVMGGEAVNAAESFGLSLNYLGIATQGARNAIGEKLLPLLQPLLDRFTAWTAANRELIATNVAKFVEGLVQWIGQLDFKRIGEEVEAFGDKVEAVVKSMGGWKNAAIGVVVVLNASLLASVVDLGLAIGKLAWVSIPAAIRGFGWLAVTLDATLVPALLRGLLSAGLYVGGLAQMAAGVPVLGALLGGLSSAFLGVGAAIAATPIGWLVAGVAAVALGVYAIYKNWDAIGDYFHKKMDAVKAAFDKSWTGGIVKALWEFSPIKLLGDTMNGLSKWLFDFDLYDAGKNVVAGLVRGIKSVASLLPNSVLKLLGLDGWALGTEQMGSPGVAPVAQPGAPASVATVAAPLASPAPGPAGSNAARGIRNNNPGNLRAWGDMPTKDGFAAFPTPEAGLRAMIKNLQAQQSVHGLNTIKDIISRWAPPSENNTGAYIAAMEKETGFGANQPLDLRDKKTVAPLVSGIIKHEGNSAGFSKSMVEDSVTRVVVEFKNAPPGINAVAKTKGGDMVPVRVNHSMPTLAAG